MIGKNNYCGMTVKRKEKPPRQAVKHFLHQLRKRGHLGPRHSKTPLQKETRSEAQPHCQKVCVRFIDIVEALADYAAIDLMSNF